jgi:tetratricopeptide (TPR) repeat protein
MRNSALVLLSLTCGPFHCQGAVVNLYPDTRTIILEAESAAAGITTLPDGSKPLSWEADLYARAGYLEDATRAATKAGVPLEQLAFARTLYGDLDGALKSVRVIPDPERRTIRMTGIAGILWRMGDQANAGKVLDESERAALTISNLAHRKLQLQLIAQQRDVLPNEPPIPLSPTPHPQTRKASASAIPAFPVTADGFRDKSPETVSRNAQENEVYLTQLYALIAAHDRNGLLKHTEAASSPFQKALGLASLEHLLIQVGAVKEAEESAQAITDNGADCSLAKAEALTAVGTAWQGAGDPEHARQAFDAALKAVASVGSELAFGKAAVTASVAAALAESGMAAMSKETFELALKFTSQVQPRPKPVNGVYPKTYFGSHFQDDAYRAIFGAAIRTRDLSAVRHMVELWRASAGSGANTSIVDVWLDAGRRDEALSYARGLKNATERVPTLLWLARSLLDEEGAPLL